RLRPPPAGERHLPGDVRLFSPLLGELRVAHHAVATGPAELRPVFGPGRRNQNDQRETETERCAQFHGGPSARKRVISEYDLDRYRQNKTFCRNSSTVDIAADSRAPFAIGST